nr:ubiquitin hydrolase [Tanacetum cinerariifolium]
MWYQSLVRSFDQQKNNIQAQQKKKMIKKSSSSKNEPCCSKDCKKNTKTLNNKITNLADKLFDAKNMIYHYKLGLAQVESRLVEHKEREIKYCEKIKGLEFRTESNNKCIHILKKKLEILKKEKEGVDGKLAGFLTASKDLDNLIESQRADKNKHRLGYSVVPPPPAQIYSSPKKDLSWTGLPEFADDTVTDYSRPSLLWKAAERSTTNKVEIVKNPSFKYAELYRKTTKRSTVRGNQRNWNNLKSQQLGENFVRKNRACFNCGHFDHLSYDYGLGRVQRLERELKARTPVHKVDKGKSRPVMAWVPKKVSFSKGQLKGKIRRCSEDKKKQRSG